MGIRANNDTEARKRRSAVTNGKRLLAGIDQRSSTARRYRDLVNGYLAETGRKEPDLCKQAASLVLQRELLDAAMVRGEPVDTLLLVRLSGAINRTLERLQRASVDPDSARKRREREDREAGLIA